MPATSSRDVDRPTTSRPRSTRCAAWTHRRERDPAAQGRGLRAWSTSWSPRSTGRSGEHDRRVGRPAGRPQHRPPRARGRAAAGVRRAVVLRRGLGAARRRRERADRPRWAMPQTAVAVVDRARWAQPARRPARPPTCSSTRRRSAPTPTRRPSRRSLLRPDLRCSTSSIGPARPASCARRAQRAPRRAAVPGCSCARPRLSFELWTGRAGAGRGHARGARRRARDRCLTWLTGIVLVGMPGSGKSTVGGSSPSGSAARSSTPTS